MFFVLIFAFAVIFSILGAIVAGFKGRSIIGWFIVCFLTGLIGFVLLIALPKNEVIAQLDDNNSKKCPFCAERVLLEAIVCKHCNREITSES